MSLDARAWVEDVEVSVKRALCDCRLCVKDVLSSIGCVSICGCLLTRRTGLIWEACISGDFSSQGALKAEVCIMLRLRHIGRRRYVT